ncbi:MraY family glycosyltransferase [Kaistia adipata]|uniref:MraY family glycosyltransferase n=1 Tax=Kaistia adipata TaxID=166954 RepID=UPI00040A65F1|nr:MraY family glycosyltransferase [Kaistia adipata]
MPIDMPALAVAFLLSVAMVEALRRLAPALGLVDQPTARKVHRGLVPVSGGLAMFLVYSTMLAGWASHASWAIAEAGWLIAALCLLVGVGVLDDRYDLRPWTKLLAQALVALALCYGWAEEDGGPMLATFGAVFAMPDWFVLPLTLLFVMGCINAFNMADGLDGLAGGMAAVALAGIAIVAMLLEHHFVLQASLLLLAVVFGFLVFNMRSPWRRRASVFMGDAGSMMLGCVIAGLILSLSSASAGEVAPPSAELFAALLWLVAIPIVDTLSLMVRRPLAGRSPMAADRSHLHHLLIDRGYSPMGAVLLLVALAALLGGIGLVGALADMPAGIMIAGLLGPIGAHATFVRAGFARRARKEPQSFDASPEVAE